MSHNPTPSLVLTAERIDPAWLRHKLNIYRVSISLNNHPALATRRKRDILPQVVQGWTIDFPY
jgi:hypothetical protein